MNDWYIAVIENPDGITYEQPYWDYLDLIDLIESLGPGYRIVCLY